MQAAELRRLFLEFFQEKGHKILPSVSVIPEDDPSLLFINAGMNAFKNVFLGKTSLPTKRVTSAQKCIRVGGKHNDLDNVGHTSRHLTFFEMLGNFSFGDYGKKDAIDFAWEFSTKNLQVPAEKIWITVYEDDQESYDLWKSYVPEDRIVRMGADDNFWSMGSTGPCGPCTELYWDTGKETHIQSVADDPEGLRFIEFWNLVFMESNRESDGSFTALPNLCVDTGMGIERMLAILNGVETVFDTDIFMPMIKKLEEVSGKSYQENPAPFRVIVDHMRSVCFAIADGAVPSNVERGYVLRKVLRRAVRYARQLGIEKPFFFHLFSPLLDSMGKVYPELVHAKDRILELIGQEERQFQKTLHRGGNLLATIIEKSQETREISGEDAFMLKDTYGFPIEEIVLLAKDAGLGVHLESYMILEEKAKERSRQAREQTDQTFSKNIFQEFLKTHSPTEFVGYESTEHTSSLVGILVGGDFQKSICEGSEGALIVESTPFYAEMGGQVGDQGEIYHQNAHFIVQDTITPYPGITIHKGYVKSGKCFMLGEPVELVVNEKRRSVIANNHTATHLLGWALDSVLKTNVTQAGSLVDDERLRFDFVCPQPLTNEQIRNIEHLVNDKIRENSKVSTREVPFTGIKDCENIKQNFADKYGDVVRVVSIGNFSQELCGGTHAKNLSDLSLFRITKTTSMGEGIRRIMAVTGQAALDYIYSQEDILHKATDLLDTSTLKLIETLNSLLKERSEQKKLIKELKKIQVRQVISELLEQKETIGNISLIKAHVDLDKEELAAVASHIFQKIDSGVLLLATSYQGQCQLHMQVSDPAMGHGIAANEVIREIAPLIEGSGGGRPNRAQAGGKKFSGIEKALIRGREIIQEKCLK